MNFGGKEYKFAVILPWIGKVVRHYKLKMCLNVVLGWQQSITTNGLSGLLAQCLW